jgi:hypothetical protein
VIKNLKNEETLALIGPQHHKKKIDCDFVKSRLVYIIFNVIGLYVVGRVAQSV